MVLDKRPVSFFCMWIFGFPSSVCCKNCPFPRALAPLSRILCLYEGLFLGSLFHSIDLYVSLSIRQYHTVFVTVALQYFKNRKCESFSFVLLCQDCFVYLGPLGIPCEFQDGFFFNLCKKKKKGHWDFDKNCTESVDCLGRVCILTALSLPIANTECLFHFLCLF